jgi:hypothetical protein
VSVACQTPLFDVPRVDAPRRYLPYVNVAINAKGVIDIDTAKGCTEGMGAYPGGGCYGECYANKIAARRGFEFRQTVVRRFCDREHKATVLKALNALPGDWYRVGVMGDPSHDWSNTLHVCWGLRWAGKTAAIITKHWNTLSEDHLDWLMKMRPVVLHTSVSALDTDEELRHRLSQRDRISARGLGSVLRVVTCCFGDSSWGRERKEVQEYLLSLTPVIDNPLRASHSNPRVLSGDILVSRRNDSVGGGKFVSLHNPKAYLGRCGGCPDQCGITRDMGEQRMANNNYQEPTLWSDRVEFLHVPSVIGSGYEAAVAELAIEDGIAHRAARKNMQIHSAVILLVNGEFAGFMTYQNNHEYKEFCLLQSVIKPDLYTDALYRQMVEQVIAANVEEYPALMTTNPKSKFETPALFASLGFHTYLKLGEFHYMALADPAAVRMKLLAHITMVNVWQTTGADWLRIKKEWNARLEEAGKEQGIDNPAFATREGCWQGTNGFANVVTGHSHNGNASVLDPTACEVILRFFMPTTGRRVYNPFGGGVQFGFVTGASGFEYLASEIRQNQCDANNALCAAFPSVEWIPSDSSTYEPGGMFDLVFTCPPYYKVERYVDYDGQPPIGEINSLSTYEQFRDALFAGYRIAIDHLNDNCFFVVMTGDSRDSKGAWYGSEAETELFLKECGLSLYNKIVYVEGAFTRLAHAKKTLKTRKFPKCEQKIIVAYKGDISKIQELYPPIGRL